MKVFFVSILLPLILIGAPYWSKPGFNGLPSDTKKVFPPEKLRPEAVRFYNTFKLLENPSIETVKHTDTKNKDGGIKEKIPKKYQEKYQRWKAELLSTEIGRKQWDDYAGRTDFTLILTIDEKKDEGAKTDKYVWDDEGKFVSATITLGSNIEKGFPDPVYYPVMNSLSPHRIPVSIDGNILAATKLAHEIGHVNQTSEVKKDIFEMQAKLMSEYTEIFLKNGYNSSDQKLIEMERQMGGTPVQIWENREYWSEVNAMTFLSEKINRDPYYCDVLTGVRTNVEQYAKDYEPRFENFTNHTCKK